MRPITIHHIDINIGTGEILTQSAAPAGVRAFRLILPKRLVDRACAIRDLRLMSPANRSTLARSAGIELTYVPITQSNAAPR